MASLKLWSESLRRARLPERIPPTTSTAVIVKFRKIEKTIFLLRVLPWPL